MSKAQAEGRAARNRRSARVEDRRARNRAAEWAREDEAEALCAECGCTDEAASMYDGASGRVCANCFHAGEGRYEVPDPPSTARMALLPLGWLVLLAPVALGWLGPDPFSRQALYWQEAVIALWIPVVLIATVGLPGVLGVLAVGAWDGLRRADLEGWDRWRIVVGNLWHAVFYLGCLAAMFGWAATTTAP